MDFTVKKEWATRGNDYYGLEANLEKSHRYMSIRVIQVEME